MKDPKVIEELKKRDEQLKEVTDDIQRVKNALIEKAANQVEGETQWDETISKEVQFEDKLDATAEEISNIQMFLATKELEKEELEKQLYDDDLDNVVDVPRKKKTKKNKLKNLINYGKEKLNDLKDAVVDTVVDTVGDKRHESKTERELRRQRKRKNRK